MAKAVRAAKYSSIYDSTLQAHHLKRVLNMLLHDMQVAYTMAMLRLNGGPPRNYKHCMIPVRAEGHNLVGVSTDIGGLESWSLGIASYSSMTNRCV